MKRMYRFAVLALVSVAIFAAVLPAFAASDTGGEDGSAEMTNTTAVDDHESITPAVPAPPPDEVDDEQPWTVRFIYPTLVAVTVILIGGLIIGYNRSIKRRYTVVSE